MPSRLALLVRKELAQHALAFVGLGALLALYFFVQAVGVLMAERSASFLEVHRAFLLGALVLAAFALGNRLVVAEYQHRTQRFLQSLPLRAAEVLAVKYALGLAVLLAAAAASLGLSALGAGRTEPLGQRFVLVLALRSAGWTCALWGFLFLMGLVGRLRVPVYLALCLAYAAARNLDLDVTRHGPFALVDARLPFERAVIPWAELGITAAWTALMGAGAGALALVRDGAAADALARPMTARERVTTGVVVFAGILVVGSMSRHAPKAPYRFTEAATLHAAREDVEVFFAREESRADAEALLAALERDLGALRRALGWARLPPVRVALRPTLDGRTVESVDLEENDGVLVRANFTAADFDRADFEAALVARVLDHATAGRAIFEPQRWVRDGFSAWWARRANAPAPGPSAFELRALWATRATGATDATLRRWTLTRERLGEPVAGAVAWSMVRHIARTRGDGAVLRLARHLYGRRPPTDVREVVHAWRHPMEREVSDAAGVPWTALVDSWAAWLGERRRDGAVSAALAGVPTVAAAVRVAPGEVVYDVRVAGGEPTAPIARVHAPLGPFDDVLEERDLLREEGVVERGVAATLPLRGRYGRGARAFAAVEVESSTLGCPLRFAARRVEVP